MRRQGNREFGVYVPPSGEDSIRRSIQIGFESTSKINNVQLGGQPQTQNPNERSVERSNQIGVDSRNKINKTGRQFEENIRQGWGGNSDDPAPPPSPPLSPSPSPSPSLPPSVALPPGAVSATQIDVSMLTTKCEVVCVTLHNHFESDYENPYVTGTEGICFKPRPVINPDTNIPTGEMIAGWDSEYVNEIYYTEDVKYSLSEWDESFKDNSIGTRWDYYEVDSDTRARCFSLFLSPSPPPPAPSFPGIASPPPPPPRKIKMCGCDCNTIASIIAEHMAEKQRLLDAIKEHIDSRAVEQLQHINKMLQDIDMNLDLQPVIDEIKRLEQNLWNGIDGV